MYNANGDVYFRNLELHKSELMRQAKMERLARQTQVKPPTTHRSWLRLTANFLNAAIAKIKPQTIAGLKTTSMLIPSQDNGLETI